MDSDCVAQLTTSLHSHPKAEQKAQNLKAHIKRKCKMRTEAEFDLPDKGGSEGEPLSCLLRMGVGKTRILCTIS